MTARACLDCSAVIEASTSRCTDCQRARWRSQPSREQRGYTRRHRELSIRYRRVHPACEIRLPGCELAATDADHILPVRVGGRSVWSNYQSACRSCHRKKTAADKELHPDAA